MFPLKWKSPSIRFSTALVVLSCLAVACGSSSPEEKAQSSARELVTAFEDGDHEKVCTLLSDRGQASLESEAQAKEGSTEVVGCQASSRFLLDGTAKVGRNTLQVDGAPEDVDLTADGAKVQ